MVHETSGDKLLSTSLHELNYNIAFKWFIFIL